MEYQQGFNNVKISDYNSNINGVYIGAKILKTDNYSGLYEAISLANYPISAMDVKKVQTIIYDIMRRANNHDSGQVKEVVFIDKEDDLKNSDKVLVMTYEDIKTADSIKETVYRDKYIRTHMTPDNFIDGYFEIIEHKDIETIKIIDELSISSKQYFPIFGFTSVYDKLEQKDKIINDQKTILSRFIKTEGEKKKFITHVSIDAVLNDILVTSSAKHPTIVWNVWHNNIPLDNLKDYLVKYKRHGDRGPSQYTQYRRLVSLYDYIKHVGS